MALCAGLYGSLVSGLSGQGFPSPDLVVTRFELSGGSRVQSGEEIGDRITLTVANEGEAVAIIPSSVGLYVSEDEVITPEDTLLIDGNRRLAGLQSGRSAEVTPRPTARIPDDFESGPAYLGVVVDDLDVVAEGNEENNSAAIAIQINGQIDVNQPHIQGISAVTGAKGDRFEIRGRKFGSNAGDVAATLSRNGRDVSLRVLGATESRVVVEVPFIPHSRAGLEHELRVGVGTGAELRIGQNLDGIEISQSARVWSGRQARRTIAQTGFRPLAAVQSHKWFHSAPPEDGAMRLAIDEDLGQGAIVDVQGSVYQRESGFETRIEGVTFSSAATRIEWARSLCQLLEEAFSAHPSAPMKLNCEVASDGAAAEVVVRSAEDGATIRSGQIDIKVRDRGDVLYPDLVVDRFGINGDLRIEAGDGIGDQVDLTVANLGKFGIDHEFSVGFYISRDESISIEDTLLANGRRPVSGLEAGQSVTVELSNEAHIPEDFESGPAYLGALLDDGRVTLEEDELDNSVSLPVTVVGPEESQGAGNAPMTELSIHSSSDGAITLEWSGSGILEAAESLAGPWISMPEASSPFLAPGDSERRFFRIVPQGSRQR